MRREPPSIERILEPRRKVLFGEGISRSGEHGIFEHVSELAKIARPGVGLEPRGERGLEPEDLLSLLGTDGFEDPVDLLAESLEHLGERRQANRQDT